MIKINVNFKKISLINRILNLFLKFIILSFINLKIIKIFINFRIYKINLKYKQEFIQTLILIKKNNNIRKEGPAYSSI
jgi:hypothetical protein